MWSLFSRDPIRDFPYDLGESITGLEEKSIWNLHSGKHKTSGAVVSIFTFDLKSCSESQANTAKSSFKRIKTLKHPNILGFIDGIETDKVIYFVTEYVRPLESYLRDENIKDQKTNLSISWGIHQVTKGLSFLINDCSLIHNNVCLASVFVNQAGEWKLGGVDYVYPSSGAESYPPVKILPSLDRYDPPEKGKNRGAVWSSDMWGLGCLIWEIFNGFLPRTSSLKSIDKIPQNLVPRYCELVSANPKSRPNPSHFIESCRADGGFLKNKLVDTLLFLEELQIKDPVEKTTFFNDLPTILDTFPTPICKHKILPQLIIAHDYGSVGPSILAPLFKLGKLLDADEYQNKIVPCIVKLFSSTDRATRVKLLQQLSLFVEHLSPKIVNEKIFPNVVNGFLDSNPLVREHTIKAMIHLASKLNYKNLNEELMKHFARLQSKDDQGGIRTNTTVCLGKIACYINAQIRQKMLISAFLRSLKDPFSPARQAGILALAATHNLYLLRECSNKLLPALCYMTMDPDKGVRDQAFKVIKCFLSKLEKVSENPELLPEMEKDVLSGGNASGGTSSWAGWALTGMSSLTSKLVRNKPTSSPQQSAKSHIGEIKLKKDKPDSEESAPEIVSQQTPETNPHLPSASEIPPPAPLLSENTDGWDDGWDNDDENWGDMEDPIDETNEVISHQIEDQGWDVNEDWTEKPSVDQVDVAPSIPASVSVRSEPSLWEQPDFSVNKQMPSTGSYDWGQNPNDDNFFSSLVNDPKKPAPKLLSRKNQSENISADTKPKPIQDDVNTTQNDSGVGWSTDDADWGNTNSWGSSNLETKSELAKKKAEERRQRMMNKKTNRTSGALKLGVQKLNKD